jgi:nucleoside-diphosphate kinase
MKMVRVDEALAHAHYEGIGTMITRYSDRVYRVNADFMMYGPVVALVLEGIDAIPVVRKLAGATDPKEAAPGTIRGDFAHTTREYANSNDARLPNLLHASANPEEAAPEIALWFSPSEIHNHEVESHLYKRGHTINR